jgi:hypothetical protein
LIRNHSHDHSSGSCSSHGHSHSHSHDHEHSHDHSHDHSHEHEHEHQLEEIEVSKVQAKRSIKTVTKPTLAVKGKAVDLDEEDEMEEMFIQGPAGIEWGGPTRGGKRPEPTRYGDWERKGRASDFK